MGLRVCNHLLSWATLILHNNVQLTEVKSYQKWLQLIKILRNIISAQAFHSRSSSAQQHGNMIFWYFPTSFSLNYILYSKWAMVCSSEQYSNEEWLSIVNSSTSIYSSGHFSLATMPLGQLSPMSLQTFSVTKPNRYLALLLYLLYLIIMQQPEIQKSSLTPPSLHFHPTPCQLPK